MVGRGAGGLTWRIGQYLIVLWAALTLNFALPRLAPGEPLDYLLGQDAGSLSAERRDVVLAQFGLDKPLPRQYVEYLAGVPRGDFGTSVRTGRPVAAGLVQPLLWTVALVTPAVLIGTVIGTALGALSAWFRRRRAGTGLLVGLLVLDSMPGFWIALILLSIFVAQLGWFPAFSALPLGGSFPGAIGEAARRLVLPVATLTLAGLGGTFLLARAALLTTLGEDYLLMAEAKGASPARLVFHHALRNALLPIQTHFALSLGLLFSGAVVVETVFSYPGLGRIIFESVVARDYPLLQGAFLLTTLGVLIANLIADATYPLIDPRARRPAGGP